MTMRGLSLFKERIETLSKTEQFKKIALMFYGAEYVLGKENFDECDCSGLIGSTLNIMGYDYRVAADWIYNNLTKDTGSGPKLAFFLDKEGVAKHVGIVLSPMRGDVFLHSTFPQGVVIEDLEKVVEKYRTVNDETVVYKVLDWSQVDIKNGVVYGLDQEWV